MIPDGLQEVLSHWDPADARKPGSNVPRVLYTIPNGGNPTGASMTTERKQQVYEVRKCGGVVGSDERMGESV